MNTVLQQLADIIKLNPWQEKILLVPTLTDGYQLLEGLGREGVSWLNVRPYTPLDLARDVIREETDEKGQSQITRTRALYLLEQIIEDMYETGQLSYFRDLYELGILSSILLPSINDLRMAFLDAGSIKAEQFVDAQKGLEITEVLNRYELAMKAEKLLDETDIFCLASAKLDSSPTLLTGKILLIPQQIECNHAAFIFLTSLKKQGALVLAEEPVPGIIKPFNYYFEADRPASQASPFGHLYSIASSPELPRNVEIYEAYGESNEVREAFRRMVSRGLPFDQCLLCCTDESTYVPLIYAQTVNLNIPVTFEPGLPYLLTAPGRLINQLLSWIESNYSGLSLYRMLSGGDMQLAGSRAAARYLRSLGIRWGRERYMEGVASQMLRMENELQIIDPEDTIYYERIQRQIELAKGCKELLDNIFSLIPDSDPQGSVEYSLLLDGTAAFMKKYSRTQNQYDAAAAEAVTSRILELKDSCAAEMDYIELLKLIRQTLEGCRVGSSGARPGHLHVASPAGGSWVNRSVTFVLGMESGKVEGKGRQDPVLLDCEREQISPRLETKSRNPERRIYRLAQFLASRRGSITLSFSSYDVIDGRPNLPSSILLQAYRLVTGQEHADYSSFTNWLKDCHAYVADSRDKVLSDSEWWLARLAEADNTYLTEKEVLDSYSGLKKGSLAARARDGQSLNEYDGRIEDRKENLDPRFQKGRILSATVIEAMAKCPFRYFLQYVLRIDPPEDLIGDSGVWLDVMERGSLLHAIYCDYQRAIFNPYRRAKPDKKLLLDIAGKNFERWKSLIPPPDERVYAMEKEAMLAGLEVFWTMHEQESRECEVSPVYFELPFGLGEEEVAAAGCGSPEPVSIKLPGGGSILLRGKIDRIDLNPATRSYQVWDFKTGGTYGYSDNAYVKQGQQVQHILYSAVAEAILKPIAGSKRAVVERAGYIFPTVKGEGERVDRDQTERLKGLMAVEAALELVGSGSFCATHQQDNCNYCDYSAVCRAPDAALMTKSRRKDNQCPAIGRWEVLQEYE